MNYFQTWNDAIVASLQNLWNKVISFIPELIGALIVLVVGLVLAHFLSKLAYKLIHLTRIDQLVHRIDATKKIEEVGVKFSFAGMISWIIKWFFIVVTLIAVVDILNLSQVTAFLQNVAAYIPNVVVAIVILVIGLIVGQFVHDIVEKSAKASHMIAHTATNLASLAKWAIIIFSLLASLVQLGVATTLIETMFMGIIAMFALAFGLAFGLGGKEHASRWIDRMSKKSM